MEECENDLFSKVQRLYLSVRTYVHSYIFMSYLLFEQTKYILNTQEKKNIGNEDMRSCWREESGEKREEKI